MCGRFGDFGCAGFLVMGIGACPLSMAGSGAVGGIAVARMARDPSRFTRCEAWKKSFGLAFLSLFLIVPLSLAILASV